MDANIDVEEMSRFCSNCGAEVLDNAVVCIKCGCSVAGQKAMPVSPEQPPKSWMVQSVLVTLFCCLPFGIVGIVNASKVESAFYSGNIDEANRLSEQAGKWTKLGFWIGLVGVIIYIIIYVGVIGLALSDY